MRTAEQCEVLGTFNEMLSAATGDGGAKRAAGTKPSWKVDTSHKAAAWRHLDPARERYDEDSGAHKLVHAAWRLLAVAWQEMRDDGLLPEEPDAIADMLKPNVPAFGGILPGPAEFERLRAEEWAERTEQKLRDAYPGDPTLTEAIKTGIVPGQRRPDTDEGPKMLRTLRVYRDDAIRRTRTASKKWLNPIA